jgi:EF hand domain-containing protein
MKMNLACIVSAMLLCNVVRAGDESANSGGSDELFKKHDANGNGKIDASEHRGYARERAELRRAEARELAAQRPKLNRQERLFYQPPRVTPEVLAQYDLNHNGKLDLAEKIQLQHDAGEKAKEAFRRYDKNGDGKLDQAELQAIDRSAFARPLDSRGSKGAKQTAEGK